MMEMIPTVCFHFFCKRVARELALKLAVIFRLLVRGASFPLNTKKTKFMVAGRSRINAPGYGDLTLGGSELEEVQSMRILVVTFDSKPTLRFIWEVVSNLRVVRQAGKLFDCPRVLKSCFNTYVCPTWCIVPRADVAGGVSFGDCLIALFAVREGFVRSNFVVCGTEVNALCLLYKISHGVDHPMNQYLKLFLQLVMLDLRPL